MAFKVGDIALMRAVVTGLGPDDTVFLELPIGAAQNTKVTALVLADELTPYAQLAVDQTAVREANCEIERLKGELAERVAADAQAKKHLLEMLHNPAPFLDHR